MSFRRKILAEAIPAFIGLALFLGYSGGVAAAESRSLVTQPIEENRLHTLAGNTRPEAIAANDQGRVDDTLLLEHMTLQLARPPEQEAAVAQMIDSLHDASSPNYHHWMTADAFGQAYGPSTKDVQTVVSWLQSRGFTVNAVTPSGLAIDFSGTAGAIRQAFHTEIHALKVNGVAHVANFSDPSIPEALAPLVVGVVSMHDFVPKSKLKQRSQYTVSSGGGQLVVPGDLATIYDIAPLFAAGYSGQGQTIALIEDTDLYTAADWTTFRSVFGLSKYTAGSLATIHPAPRNGGATCVDPLTNGDEGEAILDAEWASAAAPSAAIKIASCKNTSTFGGLIALQNLINSTAPPAIISMSYGECEPYNGAAANAAYKAIFQQAAAEGVSVFVSSGDEGAASCDADLSGATHGISVSGFASTPYNVAVGGTDFGDTAAHTNSSYWSTGNTASYASARSYIPEIPWNSSCASKLLATYYGFSTSYGASGLCASSTATRYNLITTASGSGGPSGCATGTPSRSGIVSGSCAGYAKPSWQTGTGVPGDGVRDIPDVSLFAANGAFGHYYVYCWSDWHYSDSSSCAGAPSTWSGAGGTSFASPILAGIQALVNQKQGGAQGNPNYVYYKLAAVSGNVCNSSGTITSGCVFHNVTKGDMDVDCAGAVNCYGSAGGSIGLLGLLFGSGYTGVLSLTSQSYQSAYGTSTGWNFATGLGSVDAYNLVMKWGAVH
jgi:subtilase family serine protease